MLSTCTSQDYNRHQETVSTTEHNTAVGRIWTSKRIMDWLPFKWKKENDDASGFSRCTNLCQVSHIVQESPTYTLKLSVSSTKESAKITVTFFFLCILTDNVVYILVGRAILWTMFSLISVILHLHYCYTQVSTYPVNFTLTSNPVCNLFMIAIASCMFCS